MTDYTFIRSLDPTDFIKLVVSVAQFNTDMYTGEPSVKEVPEYCTDNAAHIIACMYAQWFGIGVEGQTVDTALKLRTFMPFSDRYTLAATLYTTLAIEARS